MIPDIERNGVDRSTDLQHLLVTVSVPKFFGVRDQVAKKLLPKLHEQKLLRKLVELTVLEVLLNI